MTTHYFLSLYIYLFNHSATDGPPGCICFFFNSYLSIAKMAYLHTEPLNVGLNSRSGMVGLKVDPVKSLAERLSSPSSSSLPSQPSAPAARQRKVKKIKNKSLADTTKSPSQMPYQFILLTRTCESVLFPTPSSALDAINFIQYFPIFWGT